jgi:hypothetical protein
MGGQRKESTTNASGVCSQVIVNLGSMSQVPLSVSLGHTKKECGKNGGRQNRAEL